MIKTSIPTSDYQRFERLTDITYFFRYDAEEDTESGMTTASEDTIHMSQHTTYGDLVTMLIRCKYSLDEELALSANMRSDAEKYERQDAAYQQWREYCKSVAREYFGIERTLADAKAEKTAEITAYDTSEAVNSFMLDNAVMWISRDNRISLMNSTTILKNAGEEETTLWYGGQKYTLPCDTLIQMLSALEVYALQCYDVTEEHKAAVNELTTIEDVDAYDYTTGYPEKLVFSL